MSAPSGPATGQLPEPVRFELAPVAGGRARWEWAVPLDLIPLRLSVPVVLSPPADALLVIDGPVGGVR